MARQAEPTPATSAVLLFLRELRRALGDERVALRHEGALLELARDDHLAPVAERVRHGAGVGDRHRPPAVAVADAEAQLVPRARDRSGHDLAGDLVGPALGELGWLGR